MAKPLSSTRRKTSKVSAGLLLVRGDAANPEFLLVHPGGPFFARRDDGFWSVPKGLIDTGEDPLTAAKREFEEELGIKAPDAAYSELGSIRQKGGKRVVAFGAKGSVDLNQFHSNTFEMEWPPKSGHQRMFPEVDKAAYFDLASARIKLMEAQHPLLHRLIAALADGPGD